MGLGLDMPPGGSSDLIGTRKTRALRTPAGTELNFDGKEVKDFMQRQPATATEAATLTATATATATATVSVTEGQLLWTTRKAATKRTKESTMKRRRGKKKGAEGRKGE